MRLHALTAVTALGAACSVPPVSLDGKDCPCTDGYVCDTLTNRCLLTNDGGTIIDTPAATQCLPNLGAETEVYRYTGTLDWIEQGGTWDGTPTEIRQTDQMASAYAYRTSVNLNLANVHVLASMRETAQGNGGTPALGIALRTSLDGSSRYRCVYLSGQRQLAIQLSDGGGDTTIGTPASIPIGTTVPPSFTMEASAIGSSLSCCIREVEQARVANVTDTARTMGYPGLETVRKAAVFGSFVVFTQP